MPANSRLMHVMLNVADIDRTLAFYANLGMRVQVDRSNPAAGSRNLFFGFDSEDEVALIEVASPCDASAPGFGHVAIAVPDVVGLCDRLRASGIVPDREPRRLASGAQIAFLRDPDGHRIELVQLSGSGIARSAAAHDGLNYVVLDTGTPTIAGALPILMLHGGGSRADHFTDLMLLLAGRHRCLAYDQRGFAGTGALPGTPIDHAHWAADVPAMLDAVGVDRAVLLGWSMGASVAINAARQWPERVAETVLLGAPDPRRSVDVARLRDRQREADALSPAALRERETEHLRGVLGPEAASDPVLIDRLLAERAATPPAQFARTIEGYATRADLTQMLPMLSGPVHLVVGDHDRVCPPEACTVIREFVPQATIDVVAGCGHYYALEQPGSVAEIILRRLGDSAGR